MRPEGVSRGARRCVQEGAASTVPRYAARERMTLRPDDKALAAYLIETDLVPLGDLLRALGDSQASLRDLGESLVKLGIADGPRVVGLRAEVARRLARSKGEAVTIDVAVPAAS